MGSTENPVAATLISIKEEHRTAAIDIARGIAIVLVFLGHIPLTPEPVKIWLQSFHIPLFFICSGLVFSTKKTPSFKNFLLSQIRSLVIPLFTLGSMLYLLICFTDILNAYVRNIPLVFSWSFSDVLISLLLGYRLHRWYFSLWFLATLFFSRIVFFFITKLFGSRALPYLVISVPLIFLQWLLCMYVKGFYWSIDLLPAGIAFLSVGYFLKNSKYRDKILRPVFLPVAALLSVFLAILNYWTGNSSVGLYSCYLGNPAYYYLGAVAGSWLVLVLSYFLNKNRILEFFGKNSLVLYAFNNDFLIPLSFLAVKYIAKTGRLLQNTTLQWLLVLVCSLSAGSFLAWVTARFFPWIIGKKRVKNT